MVSTLALASNAFADDGCVRDYLSRRINCQGVEYPMDENGNIIPREPQQGSGENDQPIIDNPTETANGAGSPSGTYRLTCDAVTAGDVRVRINELSVSYRDANHVHTAADGRKLYFYWAEQDAMNEPRVIKLVGDFGSVSLSTDGLTGRFGDGEWATLDETQIHCKNSGGEYNPSKCQKHTMGVKNCRVSRK